MGLLECICGYGVAPTADDRIAKAMQTFNLKVRSRCVEAVSLHYYESSPSDEVGGGSFSEFEAIAARPRDRAFMKTAPRAGKRYKSTVAHVQEAR